MKAHVFFLNEDSSKKLNDLARKSAMTKSNLVEGIVESFIYKFEHSREEDPLADKPEYEEENVSDNGQSPEICEATFKDLYRLYDGFRGEIAAVKKRIRRIDNEIVMLRRDMIRREARYGKSDK